ncbi:hypothetical protein GF337_01975 [candidate division KSB1 bacterium]|nr:hypothetical protein [candidate division KSB1 bacterium]
MKKLILMMGLYLIPNLLFSQFVADLETGGVFSGYNDVRIPGDTGTKFSLSEELDAEPTLFYRLKLSYYLNEKHSLTLFAAPLTIESSGEINRDIIFEGVTFPANTPLDATYRFNSYRLTYRYDFYKKEKLEFGLGFTAKIRDAEIALESNELSSSKTNVGFVPIINFRLLWNFANKWGLLFEGDALAAPQGRAEDVQLALRYLISDQLALRAGYRILEGGADNEEVYNFALLNYASFGVEFTF